MALSAGLRAGGIQVTYCASGGAVVDTTLDRLDPGLQAQAAAELSDRYSVEVSGPGVVPQWVVANVMPQGAPPENAAIDLDALGR